MQKYSVIKPLSLIFKYLYLTTRRPIINQQTHSQEKLNCLRSKADLKLYRFFLAIEVIKVTNGWPMRNNIVIYLLGIFLLIQQNKFFGLIVN